MHKFHNRRHYIVLLLFIFVFLFFNAAVVCAETEEKEVDIDGLSKEIKSLEEEYPYPDFAEVFDSIQKFQFLDALEELGNWFLETVTYEITSSRILIGELVGIVIFAAVFSNISFSFQQVTIADSGFLISYFLTFSIIFSNFSIMAHLFKNTITTLSNLLKMMIPVYTIAVTASGNLSTGMIFYEYFMINISIYVYF